VRLVSKRCTVCNDMMHYVTPEQVMHESCSASRHCAGDCGRFVTWRVTFCRTCAARAARTGKARFFIDKLYDAGSVDEPTQFVCAVCLNVRSKTGDVHYLIRRGFTPRFYSRYDSPDCDHCFIYRNAPGGRENWRDGF